jgi:hypothetical protein
MVLKEPLSMQKMLIEEGEEWCFNEGCLSSIPDVREGRLLKSKKSH